MTGPSRLIGDGDLIAFLDDEIDPSERDDIQSLVASDPARSALLEAWGKNDELLRLACGKVAMEPLPAALTLTHKANADGVGDAPIQAPIRQVRRIDKIRRDQREKMVAMLVAAFAAGGLAMLAAAELTDAAPRALNAPASWIFPGLTAEIAGDASALRAMEAFRTYASDDLRPVEMVGGEDMTAWLTRRVGTPIHAPDLSAMGMKLLGGRLTPDEHGAAALILYQSGSGSRIGLYVARASSDDKELHYAEDHVAGAVWWMERGAFYAIVGRADKVGLAKTARAIRLQSLLHPHPDVAAPESD